MQLPLCSALKYSGKVTDGFFTVQKAGFCKIIIDGLNLIGTLLFAISRPEVKFWWTFKKPIFFIKIALLLNVFK